MMLSDSLIAQFQQLHLAVFGQAISAKDAARDLSQLAELIEITSRVVDGDGANYGDVEQNECQPAV